MMNWHVRKWLRYQHFMAVRHGKLLAQCVWATAYNSEFGNVKITSLRSITSPKL